MAPWQLIVSPRLSGSANMQADLDLFNDYEAGKIPSILRVYSWKPKCISVGYTQKAIEKDGWEVVKRPTGGGIVYHDEGEIAYSVITALDNLILPKGLIPSYKRISEAIVYALKKFGVAAEIHAQKVTAGQQRSNLCFEQPMEYEIVVEDKKIVGSAQKRGKKAMLQQGAIKSGRIIDLEAMAAALVEGFEERLGIQFKS